MDNVHSIHEAKSQKKPKKKSKKAVTYNQIVGKLVRAYKVQIKKILIEGSPKYVYYWGIGREKNRCERPYRSYANAENGFFNFAKKNGLLR